MFVWAWLPGSVAPVVCGIVELRGSAYRFNYGRSYLDRSEAIELYGMPLRPGLVPLPTGMNLHGALRDALPDAWGQQVILRRLTGRSGKSADPAELSFLAYMRESGSDRFGALDFQASANEYTDRSERATLADLDEAAQHLESGEPLPLALGAALEHGTSVGGARPKATLVDGTGHWIAKFASSTDVRPVVRHEAAALFLAKRMGVDTVDFRLSKTGQRDVLLVRRFDRAEGKRRMTVSGLTMLNLDEMIGRYATYPELLDVLTAQSDSPDTVGETLFRRIAANIILGNTDDHARNHAAFWDGRHLSLTPTYDLDPCRPTAWDANQAMSFGRKGERVANLAMLAKCAATYRLTRGHASTIIDECVASTRDGWAEAIDLAGLSAVEAARLRAAVLHPAIF